MTQTSLGQRLKHEMMQRGITSTDLARRADVKTSFIYDVISGKSANPSTLKLARVARSLGISLSTLAGGPDAINEFIHIPRITTEAVLSNSRISVRKHIAESYQFRTDWISQRLAANPDDLRMIYLHGDGMEPTLCQGDLLMINTARRTPSPAGIFVLFDGTTLMVRRVEYAGSDEEQRLRIACDNAQHASYERSPDEIYIIGRVVWFAREI